MRVFANIPATRAASRKFSSSNNSGRRKGSIISSSNNSSNNDGLDSLREPADDILLRSRHPPGSGDGLGFTDECGIGSSQRVQEDVHVHTSGRTDFYSADQRRVIAFAIGDLRADQGVGPRRRSGGGGNHVRRRAAGGPACATNLGNRSRSAGARQTSVQRSSAAGRPDQGIAAGIVFDLSAGQSPSGDGGMPVFADRRIEVRPANSGPRR